MYCFSNFVHTCSIMFIHCASIGMFSQPSPLHRIPPRSWWNASSCSQGSRHPNSPGESHGSRRPGPGPAPHPRRHPATEGAAAGHTTQATGGAHPGAQGRNAHQARTNTYPKRSNDQKGTDTHQKRAKCEERSYTYQAWAHVHRAFAELLLCDAVWRVFHGLSRSFRCGVRFSHERSPGHWDVSQHLPEGIPAGKLLPGMNQHRQGTGSSSAAGMGQSNALLSQDFMLRIAMVWLLEIVPLSSALDEENCSFFLWSRPTYPGHSSWWF